MSPLSCLLTVSFVAATAVARADPATVEHPSAEAHGLTLYVYKGDKPGVSACSAGCARAFPPYEAPAQARAHGDYGIIRRDDGHLQWAYKGRPLYRYAGDSAPGQHGGENAGGNWSVLHDGGTVTAQQSASDYAY